MNPALEIFFRFFIFLVIFTQKVFTFPTQKIPYSVYCNSFAHEATPTDKIFTRYPFLEPVTSHYTGGQNILDQDQQSQRSILFESTENLFKTNVVDTYKIQARLSFFSSNIYRLPSNFTYSRSNYSRVGWKYRRPLVFYLDGFWSVSTDKLCMVGSANWFSKQGNRLKLDAVLKLRFSRFITLNNSLVSGILESINFPHDSNYFDTISMLGFPRVASFKYNYTLVSNLQCNRVITRSLQDSLTSMQSLQVCSLFTQKFMTYKLKYPSNCKNCSLFGENGGYLPSFVSLYAIQCSFHDKKLRFLVEFQDRRYTPNDQSFNPEISLIGEGTWNGTKDELCIVGCHILNQSDPLGSARVGDCSIRLTLWFPAVRSIMKTHTMEGQIWTTKITDDMGLFRSVMFQSFDHSPENYGWKYEYTQMEKVRQICPKKKLVGDKYQLGYYGFDMSVKHKNMDSTGSAVPVFVGNQVYDYSRIVNPTLGVAIRPPAVDIFETTRYNGRLNISFEISFRLNVSSSLPKSGIWSLNLSTNNGRVDISAEGFYDDENGQTCMVGCRNLNLENASFDCEIVVRFQFPQGNGSFMKGSIESLRKKQDVLYFEHLDIFSLTYTKTEARKTIWRMDLEIIMVLLSNTLSCVFIVRQLFHSKKTPEMVTFLSVLMMMILTMGHMVPLMLNFEAVFTNTHNLQNIGLLEANEVIVRIVTMGAFILQFRLLQLTWAAKTNIWIHEIRTLVICLSIYLFGGSFMLLMNWKNNSYTIRSQQSIWGDLRSYAGLTLDGFLFPQIIFNIFQVSKGNALSYSFYIGTTFVRLLPHVYDLYRGPKYISHQYDRLYIYANPRADFYSASWDIVIVCAGIVFAVIIFLQQRFGGRFFFLKRSQKSVEYEMVPVASNE